MRVVILGTWPYDRTLTVVVVLIADIPIQHSINLDCQPGFRRLVRIWVRGDQSTGSSDWICNSTTLAVIVVNSIRREESNSRVKLDRRVSMKEIVSNEVETMTLRMIDAVKKEVNDGVAFNPVVVVASTKGKPRTRIPIYLISKNSRLRIHTKVLKRNTCYL